MITVKKGYNIFLVSIVILCLSIGFAAEAQEQDRFGGTLIFGISAGPTNLDLHSVTDASSRQISRNIWEGFAVLDANDEVQPELAKKWEISEDGLTWTFYLREGVLFHNGKEMTSEDAVASAIRWAEVSRFSVILGSINSINAIDKYTVEFKLDEKLGALLALMAARNGGEMLIMPKEVCEGVPRGKITEYIGTGPYKLVEWKLDQQIKLAKFKDYKPLDLEPSGYAGKKNAYFDEIIFKFIPETSTLLAGLETGELDIIEPILPMEVNRLRENKEIVLQRYPKWHLQTIFNTKGIFQNQKLRQAAVMALDMEQIMLSVGKKQENIELNQSHFRKNSIWYTGQLEKYYNQKNTEGAKKLMQEGGYNGEEIIIIATKDYSWSFDSAISIVDQLTKIGFNIKMEVFDWPTLVSRKNEFEGWDLFAAASSPRTDPVELTLSYVGGTGFYTSPVAVELMQIIAQESSFEERYNAWAKMEDHAGQNPPSIVSGHLFEFRGLRSNIKGVPEFSITILWNAYKE